MNPATKHTTRSVTKQLTLKDLHLANYKNLSVVAKKMNVVPVVAAKSSQEGTSIMNGESSLMQLVSREQQQQQERNFKNIMASIPLQKELSDFSATTQQNKVSLSNPLKNTSHHNYTFSFKVNDKLPSYFKRQTGLNQLFPEREVKTYLGVMQKTLYDQSVFTPETYAEREILSRNFVAFASLLCQIIKMKFNKWADFVDPSSGTGYFETQGRGFVSETDEIMVKQAGLKVRDLGCCRVLASLEWGTKVWLGSFVTEASGEEVQQAIQMIVSEGEQ